MQKKKDEAERLLLPPQKGGKRRTEQKQALHAITADSVIITQRKRVVLS